MEPQQPMHPHHRYVILIVILLIIAGLVYFSVRDTSEVTTPPEVASQPEQQVANPTATLSISPASTELAVGKTVTVDIVLDTGGQNIYGVDVNALHFDPKVLQVVDSNSAVDGIQISPGSLMNTTLANVVDNKAGKIQFSQVDTPETSYNGSGKLATITFKAVSAGTSNVSLDFTPGSSVDSNVAAVTGDILSNVSSASYTVK